MLKKITLITSIVGSLIFTSAVFAQTDGTLSFSFTPVSHSGYSGTRNVLAVWIQSSTGTFIKTKLRYAGNGTNDHLPTWAVNSGGTSGNCLATSCNTVSATTGATLTSFTSKSITWDGKDVNGNIVADGTYQVTIESCWNHGTSGKTTRSFTFTKGPASDIQSPTADANFTTISLAWNPTVAPTASFNSTPSSIGCSGKTITYTSTSTGIPTTYSWSFPGGTPATSTLQNPTVVYNTTGTYDASLTVTNSAGSNTSTQTNYITINQTPSITNTLPATRCDAGTVTLEATPSSGTINWYTATTGGTSLGTGTSFTTPSITTTTNYYVDVTDNGCTSTRTQVKATVVTSPTVNAITDQSICMNAQFTPITFSGNNASATFDWTNTNTGIGLAASGTGNISSFIAASSGTSTITVTPSFSGCVGIPQTFSLTVQNCSAGIDENSTSNVRIYPNPTSQFITIESKDISAFSSVELINLEGKTIRSWEINGSQTKLDVSSIAVGNYQLKLIGKNQKSIHQIQIKK